MEILIRNQSRKKLVHPIELRQLTTRVLEPILQDQPFTNPQVSVLFVDDKRIQELNRQYRHEDRPTDVLSFMMLDKNEPPASPGEPTHLGDIVISLETAHRQARDISHSLKKEIALLLVHGYLHLLGYTDDKEEDRQKMHDEQQQWLKRFEEQGLF